MRKDAIAIIVLEILISRIYMVYWLMQKISWEKCEGTMLQIKII
jgi:hypothetical protein